MNTNEYTEQPYYLLSDGVMLYDFFDLIQPDFYLGCVIKYIVRCNRKHSTPVIDLEKAIAYTRRMQGQAVYYCENVLKLHEAEAMIENAQYLQGWQKMAIKALLTAPAATVRDLLTGALMDYMLVCDGEGE